MAFCSNCGQKLADGSKFCNNSGTPIWTIKKEPQAASETNEETEYQVNTGAFAERKNVYEGEIRKCPNCGTKLSANSKFCQECGNKIEIKKPAFCTQCGESVVAGAKFCANCGASLV